MAQDDGFQLVLVDASRGDKPFKDAQFFTRLYGKKRRIKVHLKPTSTGQCLVKVLYDKSP